MAVVDGQSNQHTDELILHLQTEHGRGAEPERASLVVVREHSKRWIEHLPYQELKKFLLHAALVDTLLPDKLHLEGLPEILRMSLNLHQRVLDEVFAPHLEYEVRTRGTDEYGSQHRVFELVTHQHRALQL